MDFAELAKRTGLELRQLRYVVDYDVLDGKYIIESNLTDTHRGVPREFCEFTAFAIALTAALRDAGLSRKRAKAAMELILAWAQQRVPNVHKQRWYFAVLNLFGSAPAADVEIGDGRNLRILGDRLYFSNLIPMRTPPSMDWTVIEDGKPAADGYN